MRLGLAILADAGSDQARVRRRSSSGGSGFRDGRDKGLLPIPTVIASPCFHAKKGGTEMWYGLAWAATALIAAAPAAPDISGSWDTTYGPLVFSVTDIRDAQGNVTGKAAEAPYRSEGGTVSGELRGSILDGYWHEPHSSNRCSTQRRGTYYWGRIRFTFNPGADAYDGVWGYCDEAPERGWTGTRG